MSTPRLAAFLLEFDAETRTRYFNVIRRGGFESDFLSKKDFSRSVIYTLIFVIAILIVININIIVYYRRKSEDDFDDSFKEQKADIEPVQKTETKPIEKKEEIPKKEPTKKVEEVPDKTEKAPAKVKKTSAKVEVANKFEVFDFNDED